MSSYHAFRQAIATLSLRRNLSVVLGLSSITTPMVALCDDNKSFVDKILAKDRNGNIDWNGSMDKVAMEAGNSVQGAIDSGLPTQLSYGFVMGYCSGYALKKVGKVAAVVLGTGFVVLQSLQYGGYIKVDHSAIKTSVESMMDLNKDGTVDKEDMEQASSKIMEVLQFNMPAGGGFAAGFIGGVRSG